MSNLPNLSGRTILQVIPELAAGGAERAVIEVSEAIVRAGGTALVASKGGRLEEALAEVGGELIAMDAASKNPITMYGNVGKLKTLIAARGVNLVHARSRAPAWSAWHAATQTETPFVTTYHGAYSGISGLKKLYNSVMARGDLVIANSAWIGNHIRDTHEISEDRIVIIPRGVDFDVFSPQHVTQARIDAQRREWGLGADNPRLVLFLPARLTGWKGQILALQALAALSPEEQAGLVLVMVGDAQGRGGFVSELESEIATLGIVEATRIGGHCEDMPAALMASDIVLAPSLRPEAFGRTAAEAAAMGRPVIAADHGGARETVIEGETGARFDPGDVTSLAAAIRSLVSVGPQARASMGANGREHVLKHFSKSGLQAATLSVYTALIAQGKPKSV